MLRYLLAQTAEHQNAVCCLAEQHLLCHLSRPKAYPLVSIRIVHTVSLEIQPRSLFLCLVKPPCSGFLRWNSGEGLHLGFGLPSTLDSHFECLLNRTFLPQSPHPGATSIYAIEGHHLGAIGFWPQGRHIIIEGSYRRKEWDPTVVGKFKRCK